MKRRWKVLIKKSLVTSKKYNICSKSVVNDVTAKPHKCPLNYDGSSKAMKAGGEMQIVLKWTKKATEGLSNCG